MRSTTGARVSLWILFLAAASIGLMAAAVPHSFYTSFPLGRHWVELLPPYNQHLVIDVGGLYLGFAVLFAWGAVTLQPALVRASCCAWLLVAALHLGFHATHLDGFRPGDAIAELASLGFLLLPAAAAIWSVAEPAESVPL